MSLKEDYVLLSFAASILFTCLLINLFNIVVCTDSLKETCIDVIEGV